MEIEVLHHGEDWIAVDKPPGWVVHRTRGAASDKVLLQILRNQLGQKVYPVHRLDGGACGVLVFGLTSQAAAHLQKTILTPDSEKKYQVLVRGWLETRTQIDKSLSKDLKGELKAATSVFMPIAKYELPHPVGRYKTARYTQCEVMIQNGRRHQIRRHAAHMRHPVIGDSRYGDLKHNHFLQDYLDWRFLWLHAHYLKLEGRKICSRLGPPWHKLGQGS